MILKFCMQYVSKFEKFSSSQQTRKGQFSFQFQRSEVAKIVQTTIQLRLFHRLASLCSKSFRLGFSSTWTENFQIYKLGLERQRNQKSNGQHSPVIENVKESQKKYLLLLHWLCQSLWPCGSQQNMENIFKRCWYQTLPVSWETVCSSRSNS